LYQTLGSGQPVSSRDLAAMGISADLSVYYARAGWLTRLAKGVYARPDRPLELHASLRFLENQIPGLHVGGKTALEWRGIRQYVYQHSALDLYSWDWRPLPNWFLQDFPATLARKRLFKERAHEMIGVEPMTRETKSPSVSTAERAFLELLSEVGVSESLQEAKEIAELTDTFRSGLLQQLLNGCESVKTVRLCLALGNELSLPWAKKLKTEGLQRGSDRPWVSRRGGSLLVLR
jgi:hypothetical protein